MFSVVTVSSLLDLTLVIDVVEIVELGVVLFILVRRISAPFALISRFLRVFERIPLRVIIGVVKVEGRIIESWVILIQ